MKFLIIKIFLIGKLEILIVITLKSLSDNFLFNFIDGGILRDKDEKLFQKKIKKVLNLK